MWGAVICPGGCGTNPTPLSAQGLLLGWDIPQAGQGSPKRTKQHWDPLGFPPDSCTQAPPNPRQKSNEMGSPTPNAARPWHPPCPLSTHGGVIPLPCCPPQHRQSQALHTTSLSGVIQGGSTGPRDPGVVMGVGPTAPLSGAAHGGSVCSGHRRRGSAGPRPCAARTKPRSCCPPHLGG